jgi:hypothetical protein
MVSMQAHFDSFRYEKTGRELSVLCVEVLREVLPAWYGSSHSCTETIKPLLNGTENGHLRDSIPKLPTPIRAIQRNYPAG